MFRLHLVLSGLLFFSLCKGQIQFKCGSYTGDGNATQAITGVGFSPNVLIIKCAGANAPVMVTSTMTAGNSKLMTSTTNSATVTTYMSSLNSDGFTVKNTVQTNTASTTYHYLAIKSSTGCKVGSYTGTGAAKTISGIGFQPEVLFIIPDFADATYTNEGIYMSMRGKPTETVKFSLGTPGTAGINTWGADGFTTSSGLSAVAAYTYHYVALNDDNSSFDYGSYTNPGTAVDNTNITIAFQPVFVLDIDDTANNNPIARFNDESGDASMQMTANGETTNKIQAFNSSPVGFQIGTHANVQAPNSVNYYFAFGTSVLPVELVDFTAEIVDSKVELEWLTASEINSENFSVMRSSDGKNFEKIADLSAAGNSSSFIHYYYTDENPNSGYNYYKLVEKDFDGKTQESKLIGINFNLELNVITQLYPNPSSDKTVLYFNSKEGGMYNLRVIDFNGKMIYSAQLPAMVGENKFTLLTSDYSSGTYSLQLGDASGFYSEVKYVKSE